MPGLELVEQERVREIEPHVRAVRALWSPNTGIVDYGQVARSYAEDIMEFGGEIRTRHEALGLVRRNGRTMIDERRDRRGGEGHHLRRDLLRPRSRDDRRRAEPRIVPFRGDYYILNPERRDLVRTNIYPVPDPRFPFLGVHFTPRMNGDIWLGPNAVLAFSREGYRFRDVRPGCRRAVHQQRIPPLRPPALADRDDRDVRATSPGLFLESLQKFIPELTRTTCCPARPASAPRH